MTKFLSPFSPHTKVDFFAEFIELKIDNHINNSNGNLFYYEHWEWTQNAEIMKNASKQQRMNKENHKSVNYMNESRLWNLAIYKFSFYLF